MYCCMQLCGSVLALARQAPLGGREPPPTPYPAPYLGMRSEHRWRFTACQVIDRPPAQVARLPWLQPLPQSKTNWSGGGMGGRPRSCTWLATPFQWLAAPHKSYWRSCGRRLRRCPSQRLTGRLAGAPTRRALPPPHHLADPGVLADAARLRPQPRPSSPTAPPSPQCYAQRLPACSAAPPGAVQAGSWRLQQPAPRSAVAPAPARSRPRRRRQTHTHTTPTAAAAARRSWSSSGRAYAPLRRILWHRMRPRSTGSTATLRALTSGEQRANGASTVRRRAA